LVEKFNMRDESYSKTAIWLHWTIAALIVITFIIGLTVDDFPKSWDKAVVNAHVLMGLAVLLLSVARLWWRISHVPPAPALQAGPFLIKMAHLGHYLLYAMMFVVPLVGIPTLLYRGRWVDFGLFQLPPLLARDPQIFKPLTQIHELAAYALVGLALGHVAAALYHQFVLKDGLMSRMLGSRFR
jgi:cytochrome b561